MSLSDESFHLVRIAELESALRKIADADVDNYDSDFACAFGACQEIAKSALNAKED
jgi:hypothetical protein